MSRKETALVGGALVALSALLYAIHYFALGDAARTLTSLLEFTAFVPIEVLVLTLLVDRMLSERERRSRRHKMNMVIGAFFTDSGMGLLELLPRIAPDADELLGRLAVAPDWDEAQIRRALAVAQKAQLETGARPADLFELRERLAGGREFLLRLLQNPVLLEHEGFTDLIWAISHLTDELLARPRLDPLSEADSRHLAVDLQRAYGRLLVQWLEYMAHLRRDYPYLFSFAARVNPLREGRAVELA